MLMERVARMYYEHGLTHQEIANALGLSRVRVTRLLANARASGVVEITVHVSDSLFADEERLLVAQYNLKQAWIAPNVPNVAKATKAFATVGAEGLSQLIEKNSVVGLCLSTAVALVAGQFPNRPLGATFVPVAGSSSGLTNRASANELALHFAERTNSRAFHLPVSLLAASAEAARLARSDPGVSETLSLAAKADILVAGVGGIEPGQGILLSSLPETDRQILIDRKAVGDLAGRFFDRDGQLVDGPIDDRVVGLSLDSLRAIPTRVAIARGEKRVSALRAALTSGLINMLITDIDTARGLLA